MKPATLQLLAPLAFSQPLQALAAIYRAQTGRSLQFEFGPATGAQATSITARLAAGTAADVVLLPLRMLAEQVQAGQVQAAGLTAVFRSSIGMCVRAGQAVPDIQTEAALRQTLLQAESIALSTAGSGVYVAEQLLPRLGIAAAVRPKCRLSADEPVGQVVARGGADIGFQQIIELLSVSGIRFAGPVPEHLQLNTDVAAGVLTSAAQHAVAQDFLAFLCSPDAAQVFASAGLTPLPLSTRGTQA